MAEAGSVANEIYKVAGSIDVRAAEYNTNVMASPVASQVGGLGNLAIINIGAKKLSSIAGVRNTEPLRDLMHYS